MPTPTPRRRLGCLSQLILLGLLLGVVYFGVMAVTNPWIFTVGDRVRLLPSWEGVGDIQGPGGKYRIFVSFQPARGGSRVLPSTSVRGIGWICAPSGRSYQIQVGGGAHEVVWRDMNNRAFGLYTWQRQFWSSTHRPPKLDFTGRWAGPNLVLDDKGTVERAFRPDGSLNPKPGAPGPKQPITFVETHWWFGSPCGTSRGG
jgi:hypothetical protein